MLILIGIRPLVVPLCMLFISYNLFINYNVNKTIYAVLVFWMLIIGLIALLQVILGKSSFLNYSPSQVGLDLIGIGDYSYGGEVIKGLFRPTSIFLHTGKFGQIIYMFALAIVTRIACNEKIRIKHYIIILLSFVFVYVSGQRAAMVLLPISFALIMFANKKFNLKFTLCLFIISLSIFLLIPEQYLFFSLKRAFSGITSLDTRFGGALFSFNEIFNSYFFLGEGIGFFTFGSKIFGGDVLYSVFKNAEQGWLRIYAEVGFFGFVIYIIFIVYAVFRALNNIIKISDESIWVSYVSFFSLISFIAWSFTHDIFGNYLTMSYVFMFIGASEGVRANYTAINKKIIQNINK
jgi:O-antigen ligase